MRRRDDKCNIFQVHFMSWIIILVYAHYLVHKSKRYELNFNMPTFNVRIKLHENAENKYETYSEARMIKWKCEKCSTTFQTYKMLYKHKTDVHSYWTSNLNRTRSVNRISIQCLRKCYVYFIWLLYTFQSSAKACTIDITRETVTYRWI